MKSTSLRQAITKEKELGIQRNNTYMANLGDRCPIYMEQGFNVRELDEDHVASIQFSYEQGSYVPAIVVKPTEKGLKIVDGHHRWVAAQRAGIKAIEVKEFKGDEKSQISFMITSSQSRNLNPVERAQAYHRLSNQGMTNQEIASEVHRSLNDVRNHLSLLTASDAVVDAVKTGKLGFSVAVEEINKNGFDGVNRLEKEVEKASATGAKVTRATMKKFSKKDYEAVMTLLSDGDFTLSDELNSLIEKWESLKNSA